MKRRRRALIVEEMKPWASSPNGPIVNGVPVQPILCGYTLLVRRRDGTRSHRILAPTEEGVIEEFRRWVREEAERDLPPDCLCEITGWSWFSEHH